MLELAFPVVRSQVLSSYFQRPCSGSPGSFCKMIFFAVRAGVVKALQSNAQLSLEAGFLALLLGLPFVDLSRLLARFRIQ